ncbi:MULTISPECIES: FHA domain-containing protein [unclassified Oceanispirochaeta]|uniref:FHA domain-containing protein n=1 Tax=unclassified Oceanispirochaeta TaxID=2635722 RepID=UPI000E09797A|nr:MULTISPECIES: FHA domain-containing protein [unclassified Oceanispirochaeta]MBF9017642.1 hypothetical protein [Oceanispirochaeta sp. M2]NPD74214.1 hypothetical protein [Oceanispirochaeta sp. M1]RDG29920.1 hypothetical protein DV872_19120 [Oceanispirochaeta sp. M1]
MNSSGRYIVSLCMGLTAAILGWSVLELILSLQESFPSYTVLLLATGGLSTAAMTAVIASIEGILHKNSSKINREWTMGLVWGFAGGMIGAIAGQFFFNLILPDSVLPESYRNSYFAARIISWAIMGMFIGTAEGLRARSSQKIQAGIIAGLTGGIAGGAIVEGAMLFFPADSWLKLPGFMIMTMGTALLTILIEVKTSPGVFRVLNGTSKGRKYLINQKRTRMGSHPGCDISISGSDKVPGIAVSLKRKGMEIILQAENNFRVLVNDDYVENCSLKYDDVIKIGNSKFLYEVRQ